jgi:hypothetical protein
VVHLEYNSAPGAKLFYCRPPLSNLSLLFITSDLLFPLSANEKYVPFGFIEDNNRPRALLAKSRFHSWVRNWQLYVVKTVSFFQQRLDHYFCWWLSHSLTSVTVQVDVSVTLSTSADVSLLSLWHVGASFKPTVREPEHVSRSLPFPESFGFSGMFGFVVHRRNCSMFGHPFRRAFSCWIHIDIAYRLTSSVATQRWLTLRVFCTIFNPGKGLSSHFIYIFSSDETVEQYLTVEMFVTY